MTTDKIKDQLIDFNRQFKKNSGHFKSFEVIFDYISFLSSEPYLKDLLSPLFSYVNKQIGLMTEIVKSPEKSQAMDNISLDVLNPSNFSEMPVFNKEFNTWQKAIENKREGIIALAFCHNAKSSLVPGWRPICPRHIVRRSSARSGFRRLSRLASNLFESPSNLK